MRVFLIEPYSYSSFNSHRKIDNSEFNRWVHKRITLDALPSNPRTQGKYWQNTLPSRGWIWIWFIIPFTMIRGVLCIYCRYFELAKRWEERVEAWWGASRCLWRYKDYDDASVYRFIMQLWKIHNRQPESFEWCSALCIYTGWPRRLQHLRSIISRKRGTEWKNCVHHCV